MLKKLSFALAAILSVSLLASCVINTSDDDDEKAGSSKVDFTDYSKNYALYVSNEATQDMVLFRGSPKDGQILGGVHGSNSVHLKKNPEIFTSTKDYIVTVVTLADFNEYFESNPDVLESCPYTTFYAVYNKDSDNDYEYRISDSMNGQYKLILNNGTKYNVELRNKSAENGASLAFALANSYEMEYKMTQGEYMIFPVFRKFDSVRGAIMSAYPTYQAGEFAGEAKSFEFSLDDQTTAQQFNCRDWIKGINFTAGATYIQITNNADQGLQFFTSATGLPVTTEAGGKRINTGKSLSFTIAMKQLSSNKYQDEIIAAGYRLETNRGSKAYLNGDASTTVNYKAGNMYSYTVTGSAELGYSVTALTEADGSLKAQPVDFESIQ